MCLVDGDSEDVRVPVSIGVFHVRVQVQQLGFEDEQFSLDSEPSFRYLFFVWRDRQTCWMDMFLVVLFALRFLTSIYLLWFRLL